MSTPLFSVLIANYNNGRYLLDAVKSIQEQTYDHWEIIIVDDGSTDNSDQVYGTLSGNPRIHVFRNDRNRGVGYTKRRCVALAQGEICGFLDPDDLLAADDALQLMVQAHLAHPDASMVDSGYTITDENLVVIDERMGIPLPGMSILEACSWPFRPFISFKKKKYELTTGIDPFLRLAEDYDLYYKLEEVGETAHVDKLLYHYRHHTNSISLNSSVFKARAWHTYACVEAMKRRGLTDEKLMLFPMEDALRVEYLKATDHMKTTKTYRVGEAVLRPLKWVRLLLGIKKSMS